MHAWAPSDLLRLLKLLRSHALLVAALVAFSVGGGVFGALTEAVLEQETKEVDESILLAFREPGRPDEPVGPRWLEEMQRDFTALGGVPVLTLLTLGITLYLCFHRLFRHALLLGATVVTGQVLSGLLKFLVDRPRPNLVPHAQHVYTASFPSGHSMMAAVTYLTLGVLLARIQRTRRLKLYVMAVAVLTTVLVGVSRVYLGVHYPSDVLAGWTLGAAWAVGCFLFAEWLGMERKLEPTPANDENRSSRA